jgi:2,4-dienoyl-CoA reductase-like NADH-dependent reductase (Old Yellow Enzyme family)
MINIFENTSIAGMILKNRIIRSATHEGMGEADGSPMDKLTDLYIKLAKGGAGAIITGYAGVQKNGRTLRNMRMLDNDKFIDDYKKLNLRVAEYGVPVIAQIAHGGGQTTKKVIEEQPLAPSKKRYSLFSTLAKELTEDEIEHIIESFVLAVARSKEAGFSAAELHAGHGYLLHSFLSPHLNCRRDRWGGNTVNRFRIISEIISRSREKSGNYPILAKLSAYDGDSNGISLDEGARIAELFQKAGLDALEVSCGGADDGFHCVRVTKIPVEAAFSLAPWMKHYSMPKKAILKLLLPLVMKRHTPLFNYNVSAAELIKKYVGIPVIVVGGIRKLQDIESIINNGSADYVSMSRPFIIEPDIVNKFKSGQQTESRCINCGYCLLGVTGGTLRCYYGKISKT